LAKARRDPESVSELVPRLGALLLEAGFRQQPAKSVWTGKSNELAWVRDTWRRERIRFLWRKPPISAWSLSVSWGFAPKRGDELVAAYMNPVYKRTGRVDTRLPADLPLVGSFMARRWCEAVLADTEFALAWLRDCSSREAALRMLSNPEEVSGPAVGSPAHRKVSALVAKCAPTASGAP